MQAEKKGLKIFFVFVFWKNETGIFKKKLGRESLNLEKKKFIALAFRGRKTVG